MIRGDNKNKFLFEFKGIILYFNNSLIPSNNGWVKPWNLLLLGPSRICLNPKIFRSNRVMNITLISKKIKKTK